MTRCQSGEHVYPILSYLACSDDAGAAWVVSCQRRVGFLRKLFGESDERDIGPVLDAIDDVLKKDPRITDMRWFAETPFDPFSEKKYATSPRNQS